MWASDGPGPTPDGWAAFAVILRRPPRPDKHGEPADGSGSPGERRVVVAGEQVVRVAVDRDAAGLPELGLGEAAAEDADRPEPDLAAAWASYGVSPIAIASAAVIPLSLSRTEAKMSGWGFDRSASSAVLRSSMRSSIRAIFTYSSTSSFLPEVAMATVLPSALTRSTSSRDMGNGRTLDR